MYLVKIKCPLLAEAMKEYSTLRLYMGRYLHHDDVFISRADSRFLTTPGGKINKSELEFYLSLSDWAFNEQCQYSGRDDEKGFPIMEDGDSTKFYAAHPEGFEWEYLKIVDF